MNEENTLLNQPKVESPETASLLMECVAETGGCRVSESARYARGEPPRAQQRATESTSGVIIRKSRRQDPFRRDSKEPQWDKFQDYLKGEVRFASVAKQFPKEQTYAFAAAQENAQWRYKSYIRMLGTAW